MVRRRGHKPLSATFDTVEQAKDWASETEALLLGGDGSLTLRRALERYRDEITPAKRGWRQETVRINWWLRQPLALRRMADIRRRDLARWRDQHSRLAPATIRNLLTVISNVYREAISEWGADNLVNPVSGLRLPRHRPGRDRRLVDGEEDRLIRLLLLSGQRRTEVASMRLEWLVDDDWCIIPGSHYKGGRAHMWHVSGLARAQLPKPMPDGRYFSVLSYAPLKQELDKISGVHDWCIHDLRRSFASGCLVLGERSEVIESALGHAIGGGGLRAVYQRHSFREERRALMKRWGDHIARLVA